MLMKVRRNASALNVNDNYHFFLYLAVGSRSEPVFSPVTMTSNGHSLEFDQAHIAALWEALKESDAYVVYLAIIAGGFSFSFKGQIVDSRSPCHHICCTARTDHRGQFWCSNGAI